MNMQIYPNLCKWEKLMTYIFPERGKIDKAQFILEDQGLCLKHAKYQLPHLAAKCCAFSVYHSRKLRMCSPFIGRILKF